MDGMIIGLLSFFNDTPEMISRTFKSCRKAGVDFIIAIDGPYRMFSHSSIESTDGSLEVAKKYADLVVPAPSRAWTNQIEKRNEFFNQARNLTNPKISTADHFFIIDADEFVEGKFARKGHGDTAAIEVFETNQEGGRHFHEWQIRFVRAYDNLEYKDKHSWLWREGHILTQDVYNQTFIKLEGVRLIHDKVNRPDQRKADKVKYYQRRREPDEAAPAVLKGYPPGFEREIVLECFHEYHGTEIDGVYLMARPGNLVAVTKKKSEQLLTDFPEWFKKIGE